MSKSWRKKLLDSGLELNQTCIKVLKHGPKGLSEAWILGAMKKLYRDKVERIRKV